MVALQRVTPQYQEDLPVVRPIVWRFHVAVGQCTQCGRRVQGRHPLQTSDAVGAANVHLGPSAVALIARLHKEVGMPLAKMAALLRERFGLTVTPGGLVQVLHRAARVAAPTYAALCAQIRGSPVVSPDETGWRVGAVRHWLWAFATPETTVYRICHGRGFDEAAEVLGADFDGVLVRDGWAPYRRFTSALHQTCLAHLVRRARTLSADHPRSPWAARVQAVLPDALALRDRREAHAITEHGLAVARGRLLARLGRLLDTAPALPAAQRFAAHLDREFAAVFAFLWAPEVEATNWRAEHAIRPAVVNRKICGGNRTPRGAQTQQILASVIRTAAACRPHRTLHDAAPEPTTDRPQGPPSSAALNEDRRGCQRRLGPAPARVRQKRRQDRVCVVRTPDLGLSLPRPAHQIPRPLGAARCTRQDESRPAAPECRNACETLITRPSPSAGNTDRLGAPACHSQPAISTTASFATSSGAFGACLSTRALAVACSRVILTS